MGFGIHTWLFYGLNFGKNIPSVEPWQIFAKTSFNIKLDFSHQSFGGLPVSELGILISFAKYLNCQNVFEFGTCTGVTAYNLALNIPGKIYTLDLPEDTKPQLKLDHSEKEYIQGQFQRVYWNDKPEKNRIIALKEDSAKFDTSLFKEKMDLVFVDASHSYDYVINDSRKALQMLHTRGAVVWHDYMPAWKGVIKALNELSASLRLYHIRGTSLVIYLTPSLAKELGLNSA